MHPEKQHQRHQVYYAQTSATRIGPQTAAPKTAENARALAVLRRLACVPNAVRARALLLRDVRRCFSPIHGTARDYLLASPAGLWAARCDQRNARIETGWRDPGRRVRNGDSSEFRNSVRCVEVE